MVLDLWEPVSVKPLHDISPCDIPQEFCLYSFLAFPSWEGGSVATLDNKHSHACRFFSLVLSEEKGLALLVILISLIVLKNTERFKENSPDFLSSWKYTTYTSQFCTSLVMEDSCYDNALLFTPLKASMLFLDNMLLIYTELFSLYPSSIFMPV